MKYIVRVDLFDKLYVFIKFTRKGVVFIDKEYINDAKNGNHTKIVTSDAYFYYPFSKEIARSVTFRTNLLSFLWKDNFNFAYSSIVLNLRLRPPHMEIIDYLWNERLLRIAWYQVEIENALYWLSTLGGAFSALGDYFENCADMAGRISHHQLKLSLQLGDPELAARSKLYFSLALAQKGKLKFARHVVRKVADFAKSSKDRRLMRMCRGVWAKLRYLRLKKEGKLP